MEVSAKTYPALSFLIDLQLEVSPNQERFLKKRFAGISDAALRKLEVIAQSVRKLAQGNERTFVEDYDWYCQEQLKEELFFRRNGGYRLSTFQEAVDEVYSNEPYMTRYMNGLLITQLWWSNHTDVIEFYTDEFLGILTNGNRHLEIGPGHGLFLYLAAETNKMSSLAAWDVSPSSINATRHALTVLKTSVMPELIEQDMFENPKGTFDSIVFSEVLEHLERPGEALKVLRDLLAPRGKLFLNMPINSPAPDHIFNMESPDALENFIADHGLNITSSVFLPATNQTLERALKRKMSVNCVFICERSDA